MADNTPKTISKPMPRKGVDMYTIFKVLTDDPDKGTATYGAAVGFPVRLRLHLPTTARQIPLTQTTRRISLRTTLRKWVMS